MNLKLAAAIALAMLQYVNASADGLDYLPHDIIVTARWLSALLGTGLAAAIGAEFMARRGGNGGG